MSSFFDFKNLKTVCFLGGINCFDKLILINKKMNLSTKIISCPHQVKEYKLDKKKVFIFNKLNEKSQNLIKKNFDLNSTLFISLGARWIFKKKIINEIFKNKLINFHGSRLPYDSGGGGFSWRIMRQDRIDNQLVHLVEEGIDSGPILYNKKILIPKECIIPADIEKFRIKNFLIFYEDFIKRIKSKKKFLLKYQPDYIGRYNPRLNTKIHGWINWDLDSYDLINFINAFDEPYDGASTTINNQRVFLKNVQLHGGDSSNHPFMSGLVTRHDQDWIVVCTKDKNSLIVEKVIDVNGINIIKNINVGDRFCTSKKKIEDAKSIRVKYGAKGIK